jgi:hypothetical protein
MTQWEQIKKEYSEVNVPEQAAQRVMLGISEAKQRKKRIRSLSGYGSVAAALLLVLLLPGMMLRGGMKNDSASMEADCAPQQSAESMRVESPFANGSAAKPASSGAGDIKADKEEAKADLNDTMPVWFSHKAEISKEIIRQMEERMQENSETYYIKSDQYPGGFEMISEQQEYYVNEEGLYVIVFEAGTVAPEAMGVIEFIIPAEVAVP